MYVDHSASGRTAVVSVPSFRSSLLTFAKQTPYSETISFCCCDMVNLVDLLIHESDKAMKERRTTSAGSQQPPPPPPPVHPHYTMNTFIAFVLSKVNKEKRRRRPSRWQRRSQRVRFFSFRKVIKRFYYIQCMYVPTTTTTSRTRCRSPGGLKRDYAKERGKFNNNQHPMVLAFIINLYYMYIWACMRCARTGVESWLRVASRRPLLRRRTAAVDALSFLRPWRTVPRIP